MSGSPRGGGTAGGPRGAGDGRVRELKEDVMMAAGALVMQLEGREKEASRPGLG